MAPIPSAWPSKWQFDSGQYPIADAAERIKQTVLEPFERDIAPNETPLRRQLLFAVRSALIAADAAGSGLVREGKPIDWIREAITDREVLTVAGLQKNVINKRVEELKAAGKWHDKADGNEGWNDFQLACDHLPDRALLLAPCGSGKTLAAWRWIAAQLKNRVAGHVLFLYPTRATASEGFKDYVSWAPEADAALMHGTSGFDLADMFSNPPEGDERKGRGYDVEQRLFSLAYWPRRVFSATVDQFLAFMQYGYGPMCMLPVLADSVIVIDEVHSFDRNMFASLKDFLRSFKVPVLCMTATLSTDRRRELIEDCGLASPPTWPPGLREIAQTRRYRLHQVTDRNAAAKRVREALGAGKRVLWVVNQVKRAHAIMRDFVHGFDATNPETNLKTADGYRIICYHSRFRLADRVNRHADLMKALKDEPGPALGVTTQVCEMSLDIDVDLLVTEECPVTSLIQRMGRCNRAGNARPLDESGEVIVYPPEGDEQLPYDDNDLKGVAQFLQRMAHRDLTQEYLEQVMTDPELPCPDLLGDPLSRFLASGAYAVGPKDDDGEAFRDGNNFNRPCVLAEDVESFLQAQKAGWILAKFQNKLSQKKKCNLKALADRKPGFVVPVPWLFGKARDQYDPRHKRLPKYLGVALDGHYHAAIGFCDEILVAGRIG